MTRFLTSALVLSFGTALSLSPAIAQQSQTKNPNSTATSSSASGTAAQTSSDKMFVKRAAEGGLAEVELGKLATEKASSDDVKKFGQRMVDDHTKANDQLKQVAAQENITLPTEPSAKDKATKDRLEKLSGAEFDRAYMKDMVTDHQKDVADFARESKTGQNAAVKNFAEQTLPTLRSHLKEAEKIAPATRQTASTQRPNPGTKKTMAR